MARIHSRFATMSREDGKWHDGEGGKWGEAGKADEGLVQPPVIFYSLQPNPIVDPIQTIAFAKQAGNKIVIGKIGIENTPSGKDSLPEQQSGKNRATR